VIFSRSDRDRSGFPECSAPVLSTCTGWHLLSLLYSFTARLNEGAAEGAKGPLGGWGSESQRSPRQEGGTYPEA